MRLKVLAVSLALISIAGSAAAQRPSGSAISLPQGSRVRVKAQNMVAPLIANYLEQRGDTLVFIEEGSGPGVWSFALAQIERLETTAGQGGQNARPIAKGALIGGGVGTVAGLLFAAAVKPSDSTKTYSRPLTGLVGAAIGAGVGAIIGSRVKAEHWVGVPLPRQLSFLPNGRGGFTISIGLR